MRVLGAIVLDRKEQLMRLAVSVDQLPSLWLSSNLVPGGNRQAVDRLDDGSEIPDHLVWKQNGNILTKIRLRKRKRLCKYLENWSHPADSNRRPTDYESVALPTELGWLRWVL